MADKISQDRAQDSSIKTDDLDLGSLDDIDLDFPGEGDEGVEKGKSRRPSNPKKEFVIEAAKGLGGGVKTAAAEELRKVLPDGVAIVDSASQTYEEFKQLKDDLSRKLNPMMISVENASRKFLPRIKNFVPEKLYTRLNKKLEERAAERAGSYYNAPSKEQIEQEQIAAELSEIFRAQTEVNAERDANDTIARMTDRALSATQHKKQTIQMTHLYDAIRSTELFHRTQHMAYMKKSLELKYKHIFIARDTFNLLQASLKTYEGYLKEILHNSALPDMVKVQSGDYIRKNRTEKYGEMMTNALGSIRSKIMNKIKDTAQNVVSQLGFATDGLGAGVDMIDMNEMSGQKFNAGNMIGKGLGWLTGYFGASPLIKKGLDKLSPIIGPANTSLAGMRANATVSLEKKRQEWLGSDSILKNVIAEFLPDTFSQQSTASNDLLTKGKDATPFDVLTRQSIVEIIPGYLGKILQSVDIMRTGDVNTQEQVFNTFERKFTDVETLRADVSDRAFGDAETRKNMLTRTLAKMQAGASRNTPGKDADKIFKGLEKDINRFFMNHAQYGLVFDPEKIREFMSQSADTTPSVYIRRACNGFENNPKKVMQAICETMYNAEGRLDKNVYNDIQLSITEHYRKLDQYKSELPDVFENFGYRRFFSGNLSGQEEKKLKAIAAGADKKAAQEAKGKLSRNQGIISSVAFDNTMNFDKIVDARTGGIDFDTIDTKSEDFYRQEAYNRYRNYDASVSTMRQHGGKFGNKILDKLGFGNREAGREYDEVFTPGDKTQEASKKKTFSDVIKAGKDKLTSLGKGVSEKLSPVVSSQYNNAVKQINTYKEKFAKTEAGKKVSEQLEVLESLFKSAQKQGAEGIQWLKDQGAFDDPVGFLKKTYGETMISAKHLGEQLPALTDVEGWKQFASDRLDASSDFIKSKMESLKSTSAYAKAAEIAGSVKSQASSILNSVGVPSPKSQAPSIPSTPASPVEDLSKTINNTIDNTVAPTVAAMPNEAIDRLDKIIELITEWKTENVSNQGTIFDAVSKLSEISDNQGTLFDTLTQIDEDIKKYGAGGLRVNEASNEEELAKQLGKDTRKNSLLRRGLHAAKEGIVGTVKGVGKVYTRVYSAALKGAGTAIKGIGFAAGKAIDKTYKAAAGIGKWLTSKEDYVDIYVKGKEGGMPLVSARKQKDPDEGIFFKSNGKRVMHSRDIDSPCVDRNGQLVITEEDIKAGLVMSNSSPIGKIGSGLLALGKGYFSVYGKALTAIGSVTKAVAQGIFGKAAERYEDVYRKDEVDKGPLVTARKQKEEGVFFFQSGKRVDKTSDIHEPVCDHDRKVIISKEDIEHGLVNVNNKPLGSGATGGAIRALARGIGGALPGIGKFIGKVGGGLMDIYAKGYKGLMDIAFKGIKGAGKFIGRALGLNMDGVGGVDENLKNVIIDTNSVLHQMQLDLAKIASNFKSQSMEGTAPTSTPPPSTGTSETKAGASASDREEETTAAKTSTSTSSDDTDGDDLFSRIKNLINKSPKAESIKNKFTSIKDKATNTIKDKLTSGLNSFTNGLNKTSEYIENHTDKPSDVLDSIKNKFTSIKDKASSFIPGIFKKSIDNIPAKTTETTDKEGNTDISTPEGTEITVKPAMEPVTETAIVGTGASVASILDLLKNQFDKKSALDKDGDGDIDGSYADQMEKKKESDQKRIDARDVHKDVNWLKKDEDKEGGGKDDKEGGGLFDALGKLIPKKYRRKFEAYKRLFSSKISRFAKGIGGKVLKFGKGFSSKLFSTVGSLGSKVLGVGKSLGAKAVPYLSTAGKAAAGVGKTLGSKALSLGVKALPWVAKAGGAAMHGLGALGSAAGGLLGSAGSAISGGLASMGGLAGLGSTLAAVAGPAALAALAGYGIYRGVKGFSKKNTLENVGKSEGISKENQLTGEDRMYSALGLNSKIGAKTMKFISQGLGIHGLIKGIRGNDNPLTDKEIEKGRTKLQRKIDKGLPGYDRILQEYEKAIDAGNWRRARELSGQEADGLIKSMWKNSWVNMATKGIGNFFFGKKDEEMSKEEIEKTRAKFDSKIRKGGTAGKNAEKLLGEFDDAISEQNWKKAREIAGAEKRGLFGKLFQDSKGNIQWGSVIGSALGPVGYLVGSLFNKADVNKPMTDEEIKKARERLQKLIDGGNKKAEKILEMFDEAVTEQNWKKARKLVGEEVQSNLKKLGSGLKTVGKWSARIATFGLSTLFESDQDKPMTDVEIKKFTDKMNYLIEKHGDKLAKKKLDKFEEAVAAQKWEVARKIAKMPHKSRIAKTFKAVGSYLFGDNEKEMTEAEMSKFRESMDRKIKIGGAIGRVAQKKLDAFEDAIGAQRWKRARAIADAKDDGAIVGSAKRVGKSIANGFRFLFGGDGKPMDDAEIERARKEFGWAIQDGKKGAQKRLDMFEDYVKDEKWEKARKIAKMPYENVAKRVGKAIGSFLFGNDKNAMTPQEIDKFRGELEQKIADGNGSVPKLQKMLDQFNSAVDSENWAKARKIANLKDSGVVGTIKSGIKKLFSPSSWFSSNYDDCAELKTKIEERIDDEGDDTGILSKGLTQFDVLVRRQQYDDAEKFGKDLLNLNINEIAEKHHLETDEYKQMIADANKLRADIEAAQKKTGFFDFLKKMRLSSIKNNLDRNPGQWSDPTFFEDLRDQLAEVTGEAQFSNDIDKPDDKTIKDGQLLVEDIKKTSDNFSWIGSPIIKTKLNSLKNEVESDMTAWDEAAFTTWRQRLKEIAGDDTVDSRAKDKEVVEVTEETEEVPATATEEYKQLEKRLAKLQQKEFEARFGSTALTEDEIDEIASIKDLLVNLQKRGKIKKTEIKQITSKFIKGDQNRKDEEAAEAEENKQLEIGNTEHVDKVNLKETLGLSDETKKEDKGKIASVEKAQVDQKQLKKDKERLVELQKKAFEARFDGQELTEDEKKEMQDLDAKIKSSESGIKTTYSYDAQGKHKDTNYDEFINANEDLKKDLENIKNSDRPDELKNDLIFKKIQRTVDAKQRKEITASEKSNAMKKAGFADDEVYNKARKRMEFLLEKESKLDDEGKELPPKLKAELNDLEDKIGMVEDSTSKKHIDKLMTDKKKSDEAYDERQLDAKKDAAGQDDIFVKGQQLLDDIEKTSDKFSWIGSPIIKMQLSSLKSEVKGSVSDWTEDSIKSWRDRLNSIAGEKAEDSSKVKATKQDDAIVNSANTLLKDIEATKSKLGFFDFMDKMKLNSLKNEIESDPSTWNDEKITEWRNKLKNISGDKTVDTSIRETKTDENKPVTKQTGKAVDEAQKMFDFYGTKPEVSTTANGGIHVVRKASGRKVAGQFLGDLLTEKQYELLKSLKGTMMDQTSNDPDLQQKFTLAEQGKFRNLTPDEQASEDAERAQSKQDEFDQAEWESEHPDQAWENNFAKGGFVKRGWNWLKDKFGKIRNKGKGFLKREWNWLKGKFTKKPTQDTDADGNPIKYGEAGTEAILPIKNVPGNLLSRIGSKLGDIFSGKPVGETDDQAKDASVHADDSEAKPMINRMSSELAKSVRDKMHFGLPMGGLASHLKDTFKGVKSTLGKVFGFDSDEPAQSTDHQQTEQPTENAPESNGLFSKMYDWGTNKLKELANPIHDVSLLQQPSSKNEGAADISAQKNTESISPLDRLTKMFGNLEDKLTPTPATPTVAPESGDTDKKLAEMTEVNRQLLKLLQQVLTAEGVKVAGMDALTQVCASSGSSTQIIQQAAPANEDNDRGIDLRRRVQM